MNNNTRVEYVDFAKAIAILLMVLLHSNYTYRGFNSAVGSFHMAVFFFTAGLFAKGKETPVSDVLKKSFVQLIIPYFAFSVFALTYGWVFPYLHPELYYTDRTFIDIFKKAVIGILLMRDRVTSYAFQPCAALWFLSSLFWCRFLFSLWIHSDKKTFFVTRALIIIVLLLCYYLNISYFALNSTAISIPYFIGGYYLSHLLLRDYGNIRVMYFIFLAIFAFSAVFTMKDHSVMPDDAQINGNPFLAYARGILGIAGVISVAIILEKSRLKPIIRVLKYLGESTLTILGLHIAGIIIFKVIYVSLGGEKESIPMTLAIPATILISMICAYIHHKWLKRKLPWVIGKQKAK